MDLREIEEKQRNKGRFQDFLATATGKMELPYPDISEIAGDLCSEAKINILIFVMLGLCVYRTSKQRTGPLTTTTIPVRPNSQYLRKAVGGRGWRKFIN